MTFYKYPVKKIGITSDFGYRDGKFHSGLDLGWFDHQGEEVYSIGKGEVIEKGFTSTQGNYLVIRHNDRDTSRYMHLKSSASVNIGDIVTMGRVLGYMGTTGNSKEVHLHIGFSRDGIDIDPKKVLYVYEDQIVEKNTKGIYKLLYFLPLKVKSTIRDINKNQLKVNGDLTVRKGAGIGFEKYSEMIVSGIYDYFELIENEGYTWYKVGDDAYIAMASDRVEILDKKITENESAEKSKKL